MLNKEVIDKYNNTRVTKAKNIVCHAPFVNLNFEQSGNVTACCYNRTFVLGKYPDNSIKEIWSGKKASKLRQYIKSGDLSDGCSACKEVIESGNFYGSKARFYDEYATMPIDNWVKKIFTPKTNTIFPKVLEFEISNSCNLECTMCNGYFSSAIRKNREHLPALKNHYNSQFVEELTDFIPHLTDAKFLGGEPFLIDTYYKIWDKIIELKPNIRVHITTNGTILNKKTIKYLEKLNAGIVISIESLNKENYEQIRLNASFDEVMKNIDFFKNYTKRKRTYLSFAVCPIQKNWMDIPQVLDYCNENNIRIHFNTVWTPESESLKFLDFNTLEEVIKLYESYNTKVNTKISNYNVQILHDFTNTLNSWQQDISEEKLDDKSIIGVKESILSVNIPDNQFNYQFSKEILTIISEFYREAHSKSTYEVLMTSIFHKGKPEEFIDSYYECLNVIAKETLDTKEYKEFKRKTESLSSLLSELNNPDALCKEMIRSGFIFLFEFICKTPKEDLRTLVSSRF